MGLVELYRTTQNKKYLSLAETFINNRGKSRAFINDTPVTLSTLRTTGALLLNMHQQFDTIDINQEETQRKYIDAIAKNIEIRDKYSKRFSLYKSIKSDLEALKRKGKQSAQELDYLKYQLTELQEAGVSRISIGGSLARATFGLIRNAAKEMLENGTFEFSKQQIVDNELCNLFKKND